MIAIPLQADTKAVAFCKKIQHLQLVVIVVGCSKI